MTLDDFKALRDAMRRKNPTYKVPGRRHQPPPPEWKLYVASDNRSGPEFMSVMYVDVTKARATATGYQYPADSVKIDMGFIPKTVPPGALCNPKLIVDLLGGLSKAHRLLTPVAGGWRPVAGFPFTKAHWDKDRVEKVSRLCRDLTRILTHPF
jgi:hypothetical protein